MGNDSQESQPARHTIFCDCCGTEPLAEMTEDRIVIQRIRGQRVHFAVIVLKGEPPAASERQDNLYAHRR